MVAKTSPTIRRSCRKACVRMDRGPAPRLRYPSSAPYPSTDCRALSGASASESVGESLGTWRWNDAVLGMDGPPRGRGPHVGVNGANARAVGFRSRRGFDPLKLEDGDPGSTIWMGAPEPWHG